MRRIGSEAIALEPHLLAQLLDHARREAPRECCGALSLVRTGGGRDHRVSTGPLPLRYHPARNQAASTSRYEMDPDDLLAILDGLDAAGASLWGLFHSHPRHEALPSAVDRAHAYYPEAVYLILSLMPGASPGCGLEVQGAALRGFRIRDGEVTEVALTLAGLNDPPSPPSTIPAF